MLRSRPPDQRGAIPLGLRVAVFGVPLPPSRVEEHVEKDGIRTVRNGIGNAGWIAARSSCTALVVELRPDDNRVRVWTCLPLRMNPVEGLVAERNVHVVGDFVLDAANRPCEIHRVIR